MFGKIQWYVIGVSLVALLFEPTRFLGLATYSITFLIVMVKQLNAASIARKAELADSSGAAGCQVMAVLENFRSSQREAKLQAFRERTNPVVPPPLPASDSSDEVHALERLNVLLKKQLVSQEEFDSKRREILNRI